MSPKNCFFNCIALGVFLFSCEVFAQTVSRGPYLQMNSDTAITLKWRTSIATDSVVRFGTSLSTLDQTVTQAASVIDHEVRLPGLQAKTQYYYSVGSSSGALMGGTEGYRFKTSPSLGSATPTRIWLIGDSGTGDSSAKAVYNAYLNFENSNNTDLWIMLGDNAYNSGTDAEFQKAVFDIYPELLRRVPLWATIGNHDGMTADSSTESGPYYDIFTFPRNAESGGLASGTEAYYSFDYGDIHFLCLDSYETNRSVDGAMMTWMRNDVAATKQKWIIAYWHHPPYSKGSHNSDTEVELIDMRTKALPPLEQYGVDLVLSGHSHSYERSYFINGHYGASTTFGPATIVNGGSGQESKGGSYFKADGAANAGTVYTVAGSSGKISGGALNHPAMFASLNQLGSVVLDVNGDRLDAKFLNSSGNITDSYTLLKGQDTTPPVLVSAKVITKNEVLVTFSERVVVAASENIGNYAINNGVSIVSAKSSGYEITLNVSSLMPGSEYSLTVNNIADLNGKLIKPNSQVLFTSPKDTTLPVLVSAQAINASEVLLTFSESIAVAASENAANYAINNGVSVVSARNNGDKITLITSSLTPKLEHKVTINNVADLSGNVIAADSQTLFRFQLISTIEFQNGLLPATTYEGNQDTYVASGNPSGNFGAITSVLADGADGADGELATLLQWDVSSIPAAAEIVSADITLEVFNASAGTYKLWQGGVAWAEDAATWTSINPRVTKGAEVGTVSPATSGLYTISLNTAGLAMLQAWVSGVNNGVVILSTGSTDGIDVHSSEFATAAMRPKLSVRYTLADVAVANVLPVSNFTFVATGLDTVFQDTSTDSNGTLVSWQWDFGDGTQSSIQNPSHSYASAGPYVVKLTVTDNESGSNAVTKNVSVAAIAVVAPPSKKKGSGSSDWLLAAIMALIFSFGVQFIRRRP
jgi:PKD repeat protein